MGNLFGVRRRAPPITAQDRTILQLKQQRDKIKMYQKRTESELARNGDLALNLFRNGMKDRAIIVLRRKKMMENILSRTDKQLETLEGMVADIEYTQIEVSVVEGLKVGTEALKQLNSLMNIDDIQQMMEDNAEAAEKQREISAILQQSSERYDEQDLLKELEGYREPQTEPQIQEEEEAPAEEPKETAMDEILDLLPEVPEEPGESDVPEKPDVPEVAKKPSSRDERRPNKGRELVTE